MCVAGGYRMWRAGVWSEGGCVEGGWGNVRGVESRPGQGRGGRGQGSVATRHGPAGCVGGRLIPSSCFPAVGGTRKFYNTQVYNNALGHLGVAFADYPATPAPTSPPLMPSTPPLTYKQTAVTAPHCPPFGKSYL
mgnify:CR=1 FL=1